MDDLIANPHQFDFFEAVYLLERTSEIQHQPGHPADKVFVGHDGPLAKEPIRFKSDPGLGFNGLAISQIIRANIEHSTKDKSVIDSKDGLTSNSAEKKRKSIKESWQMMVSCMGLIGVDGALPQHYSELIQQRIKMRDYALLDFIDMFNHRLISLFYRAWEKYRIPLHHGKALRLGQRDTFSKCIDSLTGNLHEQAVLNYYSGFFACHVRSASKLQTMLSDFLQVPVQIEQFCGHWLDIEPDEQIQFDVNNKSLAQLGESAFLGKQYWSVQNKININIGPLSYQQFDSLLPGKPLHKMLKKLTGEYLGNTQKVAVGLWMNEQPMKFLQLSEINNCLGYSTWLGQSSDENTKEDYLMIANF